MSGAGEDAPLIPSPGRRGRTRRRKENASDSPRAQVEEPKLSALDRAKARKAAREKGIVDEDDGGGEASPRRMKSRFGKAQEKERSENESPRNGSANGSDSDAELESPRSLATSRKTHLVGKDMMESNIVSRPFKFQMFKNTEDVNEVTRPKRSTITQTARRGTGKSVMENQGFFAPNVTTATPANLMAMTDRLKRTAHADTLTRNWTPEGTVDSAVLHKNLDMLNEYDTRSLLTSVRTGDPIDEQFFEGHVRVFADPYAPTRRGPTLPEEDEVMNPNYRSVRVRAAVDKHGRMRDRPPVYLQVMVNKMLLTKHPRFAKEDFLSSALIGEYHQYWRHMHEDSDYNNILRLNKYYDYLKQKFEGVRTHQLDEGEKNKFSSELVDLTLQLTELLSETIAEKRSGQQSQKNVYMAWSALKLQRKRQKYKSTPVVLDVRKMESLITHYKSVEKMAKLICDIFNYMPSSFESENYNIGLLQSNMSRICSEIKEEVRHYNATGKGGQVDNMLKLSYENVDGEDVLHAKINDDPVAKREINRRHSIMREVYFVKLVVNGQVLEQSPDRPLAWPQYQINFSETFNLKLNRRPNDIHLELWRRESLGRAFLVAKHIPVAIPGLEADEVSATTLSPVQKYYDFSADEPSLFDKTTLNPVDNSLGIALLSAEVANNRLVEHYLTGAVSCTVNWLASLDVHTNTEHGNLTALIPPKDFHAVEKRLIGHEIANGGLEESPPAYEMLKALSGNATSDPNDPCGFQKQHEMPTKKQNKFFKERKKMFCLSKPDPDFDFSQSNLHEYKSSSRSELLKLRSEIPHMFTGSNPIPLSESEINRDQHWRILLRPSAVDDNFDDDLESADFDEQIILKRQKRIQGFVQRVKDASASVHRKKHRHEATAFVKQNMLPDFSLDLSFLVGLFAPRRKLRPQPVARKAEAIVRSCNLFVQIVRAANVPHRRRANNMKTAPGSPGGNRSPSPRRNQRVEDGGDDAVGTDSFLPNVIVECRFQGRTGSTTPQTSNSPSWGEAVTLPFSPSNNAGANAWTPDNLMLERDEVTITFFDVTEKEQPNYERGSSAKKAIRTKRYIGSFSIPFTTIYMQDRVQGHFRVTTPLVNLGYDTINAEDDSRANGATGTPDLAAILRKKSQNATTLHIMATLDTPLIKPAEALPEIRGGEDQAMQQRARKFVASLKSKKFMKNREVMVLAPTLDGDMLLVSKFIYPQQPPRGLTGKVMNTVTEIVRFVSLVPFLEDFQLSQGQTEAWNTSHDFLQLCAGDWEEHAILLCNYFNYIDNSIYQSYIVIGNGIPEGKTVYVMRVKLSNPKEDIVFWNASTGEGFAVDDETCPLRIGTIVNQDNIWVNIQSTDDPSHMEFKLSDPNCFKCFFDAKYPKGQMETCQIPVLEYTIPDELYLEQLERQILNTLKEEFREWRGNRAMTLQSVLEKELQATLESMEYEVSGLQGDVPFSTYEHIRSLEKYTRNYKMYGFPINASFTDIKSILRKVKATDVHQSEIPASKFAFGVKCVGYPCGVISVWIYIATLEPIR